MQRICNSRKCIVLITRYTAMFLKSAFKFHTRLLDMVHNKVFNTRFVAIVYVTIYSIAFMTWRRGKCLPIVEKPRHQLCWGAAPRAELLPLSRSLARACRCKSIRWFDDLGTRSNSGTESSLKVLWHRQNFRHDKAMPSRVSGCIHVAAPTAVAPSLFAEVVIKYRSALAHGKIGVAVPLKIIAPPCCSDRLHSGFNLVRPLLCSIYADGIYWKTLHIETWIKTKLQSTNGIKLI